MNAVNLEGRNVVVEALKRGRKIFEIRIDRNAKGEKIEEVAKLAREKKVLVSSVDRSSLDKLSKTESHQGIIALAEPVEIHSVSEVLKKIKNPCILLIKEVLYEHNLGAILRSAAAAGVDAVVIPPTRSFAITPVVERVSMGASYAVTICQESTMSALSVIKRAGIKIVGVETFGSKAYFEEDLTGAIALVFGGEDESLSLPLSQKCDIVVRVPMQNDVQSLNLSVACAVVLFEKRAQDAALEKGRALTGKL